MQNLGMFRGNWLYHTARDNFECPYGYRQSLQGFMTRTRLNVSSSSDLRYIITPLLKQIFLLL